MTTTEESDQVLQRRANLEELRRLGVSAYPGRFDPQASVDEVVRSYGGRSAEELGMALTARGVGVDEAEIQELSGGGN